MPSAPPSPACAPCPSPAPLRPVARSSCPAPHHPLVNFPSWPRQGELGPQRGSAALGSSAKNVEEATGTWPKMGHDGGLHPEGGQLSHPGAGHTTEAAEQPRPPRLSAPLKKVSSFRKCKWSSRCWTTTSWERTKPSARSSRAATPPARSCGTGPTCWPTPGGPSPSGTR